MPLRDFFPRFPTLLLAQLEKMVLNSRRLQVRVNKEIRPGFLARDFRPKLERNPISTMTSKNLRLFGFIYSDDNVSLLLESDRGTVTS